MEIATFLSSFNHSEAANDNKYDMFKDDDIKYDAIQEHKMAIVAVEADLDEQLIEIRKILKHSKLNYVTVAGIEVSTQKITFLLRDTGLMTSI
jgi:DNA mismatch repair protein MSH3